MMANEVLDFSDLIFIERGIRTPGSEIDGDHMCDQYFGHNARLGGGMYILKNFNIASKSQYYDRAYYTQWPNKGKLMTSELSFTRSFIRWKNHCFLVLRWKYQMVTSKSFNIFTVNVDGNLKRITDGNYDDIHPCWLPDGRVFSFPPAEVVMAVPFSTRSNLHLAFYEPRWQ